MNFDQNSLFSKLLMRVVLNYAYVLNFTASFLCTARFSTSALKVAHNEQPLLKIQWRRLVNVVRSVFCLLGRRSVNLNTKLHRQFSFVQYSLLLGTVELRAIWSIHKNGPIQPNEM